MLIHELENYLLENLTRMLDLMKYENVNITTVAPWK